MRYSVWPFSNWPGWTPAIPKFYWDVRDQEQRIKHIAREWCHVTDYLDYLSNTISKADVASKKEFDRLKTDVANALDELRDVIVSTESGALDWDVTRGEYNTTVEAMRNTVRLVTFYGITCEELAQSDETVNTLTTCGLNVNGLTVFGRMLLDSNVKPTPEYVA